MAFFNTTEWSNRARLKALPWPGALGDGALGDGALGDGALENRMELMNWNDICQHDDYAGRWVALDRCRYDAGSGRATEGAVVDVDDDLVELCNRIRNSEHHGCEILFCDADGDAQPAPCDSEDPFHHTAH